VATILIFGIAAQVCREDYDEAAEIFDNAKSRYLDSSSQYTKTKAKEKLEMNKRDYMLHEDGTPCYRKDDKYGMTEDDKKKYLNWNPAELKVVDDFAGMSMKTLNKLQALFEHQAQIAFEIHYDSTYMTSENMPQTPFEIYCKSGELMDALRRLATQIVVATDKKRDSSNQKQN